VQEAFEETARRVPHRGYQMNILGYPGSYHKPLISNPPTPLPPMFKTAPNFKSTNAGTNLTFDFGGYGY